MATIRKSDTINRVTDMLQRADARTARFICILLGAMLGEVETE